MTSSTLLPWCISWRCCVLQMVQRRFHRVFRASFTRYKLEFRTTGTCTWAKKMHFCLCVEPPTFYSCLLLHRNVCYVTYTTRWWRNRGIDKYNNWLASLKTQHSIIKQVEILHNLIWVRKKWLSTFLPSGICWVLWGTVKPAFSWLVVHLKQSDWQKGNGFIYVFFFHRTKM